MPIRLATRIASADREGVPEHRVHTLPGPDRLAEITLRGVGDELPELDRQRVVQPVLLPDRAERLRIAVLPGQREGRIAGQRPDPEEDHDRCQQQRD